jgi:hypothetical protein
VLYIAQFLAAGLSIGLIAQVGRLEPLSFRRRLAAGLAFSMIAWLAHFEDQCQNIFKKIKSYLKKEAANPHVQSQVYKGVLVSVFV